MIWLGFLLAIIYLPILIILLNWFPALIPIGLSVIASYVIYLPFKRKHKSEEAIRMTTFVTGLYLIVIIPLFLYFRKIARETQAIAEAQGVELLGMFGTPSLTTLIITCSLFTLVPLIITYLRGLKMQKVE